MESEEQYFKLPCGYITEDGQFYTYIKVRVMTGEEEDNLSNNHRRNGHRWLDDLIAGCCTLTTSPEDVENIATLELTPEITRDMTLGDRFVALMRIRQVTYGKKYRFEFDCESCGAKSKYDLDLNSLELDPMPEPRVREYTFKLPMKGDEIKYKVATAKEEAMGEKYLKQYKNSGPTANLACRLLTVNGEQITNPMKYFKSLTVPDRNAFRADMTLREGGIQTKLEGIECRSCGQTVDMELPIQQAFFSPTSEK